MDEKQLSEIDDDAFCEALYQSYLNDPDKGEAILLTKAVRILGVCLKNQKDTPDLL